MKKGTRRIIGKRKVWIALAVFVIGFVLLVGRLIVLQIKDYGYYSKASAQEQINQIKLPALRGKIYDRNMTTLAQSAAVWDVAVSPYYIDDKDKKKRQKVLNNIADNLSQILNLDRTKLYNQINNDSKYIVVAKKIEKDTADLDEDHVAGVFKPLYKGLMAVTARLPAFDDLIRYLLIPRVIKLIVFMHYALLQC